MLRRWADRLKRRYDVWYEPDNPAPQAQCPCCDDVSLPVRNQSLICPVCFWEDDGQDIDELDRMSGPSHGISLRAGRLNVSAFGACELAMKQYVLPPEERLRFERRPIRAAMVLPESRLRVSGANRSGVHDRRLSHRAVRARSYRLLIVLSRVPRRGR